MKALVGMLAAILSVGIGVARAAEGGAGVTGMTSESIEIERGNDDRQINLGSKGGADSARGVEGSTQVTMSCSTKENKRRITITVNNQSPRLQRCRSQCFYRTSSERTGVYRCEGSIDGGFNGELCTLYDPDLSYQVTNPGTFDCVAER